MTADFRACILAVFTNVDGLVLVGERTLPAGSWQFPQGGIDPGETPEEAVRREMREEVGVDDFTILARSAGSIRYYFPPDLQAPLAKKFRGQDQIWFKLRLADGQEPSLARATDKEFGKLAWVTPVEALQRAVEFKKPAYEEGLKELGLLIPVIAPS